MGRAFSRAGVAPALPALSRITRAEGRESPQPTGALTPHPSPVSDGKAVVAEEVCGLLAVSEQQHPHHAVQRKRGGALCTHSVCHVQRPKGILADLQAEANHCGQPCQDHRVGP